MGHPLDTRLGVGAYYMKWTMSSIRSEYMKSGQGEMSIRVIKVEYCGGGRRHIERPVPGLVAGTGQEARPASLLSKQQVQGCKGRSQDWNLSHYG